ncbi:hypothetical protein [Trinickia acidisoli]|uniref:hypothetical protein n=1 Tax=Trinickia acidisoli TaxID=2767482 RepID=UPI001A8D67F2|nr:hypothetical protein [Trinickia acidisoli]
MKILEKNGKKLVFGLEWRLLVKSGSPASLATQYALTAKAPLMWHDGKSAFAGFMPPANDGRTPSNGTHLYAAAVAFRRLPGLPANALLVLKTADNSFAMVGITGGRPRRGFDHGGLTTDEVRQYYDQFGNLCGDEGFAFVGDTDLPFIERTTPFTLDELATLADPSCLLKTPNRTPLYKALIYGAVFCVIGAVLGPWWWHTFHKGSQAQQPVDPTQQYRRLLAAHENDPVVPANDYANWYAWVRSLSPIYGGWTLQNAECSFHNKQSGPTTSYVPWDGRAQCVLTYKRTERAFATNETFMREIPTDWRNASFYNVNRDSMQVSLQPNLLRPTPLRALLNVSGDATDRDVHFISQLQQADALAASAGTGRNARIGSPAPLLTIPGGAGAVCGVPTWSRAGWHITTPLHYVELLSQFPPYTTITSAAVTISQSPNANETPFTADVTGEVITRNAIVACPTRRDAP